MDCPFRTGARYRVLKDFTSLRDRFTAGEELVFDSSAWSRYDGMNGYFFTDTRTGQPRSWDIDDNLDTGIWTELFEEVRE